MYIPIIYSLIASIVVMLVSLSGVIFTSQRLSGWMEKNMKYLISFSAGVFLIVFFNLTGETYEHTQSIWTTVSYLVAGFLLLSTVSAFIPEFHHHHTKDTDHVHSAQSANRIIVGDAIHNIGDGIVLVIAFSINPFVGFITTLSIVIHEAIQEISEFFVLRDAGLSVRGALIRNFISSITIIVGVFIGFFVANTEAITALILGISAGAFLYISSKDLLPRIIKHALEERSYARYIQFVLLGMAIIFALTYYAGHAHEEKSKVDERAYIAMLVVG